MKANVIQVKTYGRVGSNIITNYFSNVGYVQLNHFDTEKINQQISYGKKVIVHDHSHDYVIPRVGNLSLCMFVKRRNAVQQVLSMMVAKHFNFYHDISEGFNDGIESNLPTELTPFKIKKEPLLGEARIFSEWHHNSAITLMNSGLPVFVTFYEDFIDDLNYFGFLHDRHGYRHMTTPERKNRLQPENVIENYEEVTRWLSEWNLNTGVY